MATAQRSRKTRRTTPKASAAPKVQASKALKRDHKTEWTPILADLEKDVTKANVTHLALSQLVLSYFTRAASLLAVSVPQKKVRHVYADKFVQGLIYLKHGKDVKESTLQSEMSNIYNYVRAYRVLSEDRSSGTCKTPKSWSGFRDRPDKGAASTAAKSKTLADGKSAPTVPLKGFTKEQVTLVKQLEQAASELNKKRGGPKRVTTALEQCLKQLISKPAQIVSSNGKKK